jgi:hypothetical protein
MKQLKKLTKKEWEEEGTKRFGPDMLKWKFVCPSCGHITSVNDWKEAGAKIDAVAFSCVGRWIGANGENTFGQKGGPCNYAGGGLIGLNPQVVIDDNGVEHSMFAFADI